MRKIVFALAFIVLFIVACSSHKREENIMSLESVRLYSAINNEVNYSERVFKGDDAKLFADVVRAECPQGVGAEFVRVELAAPSSSLILYTDETGKNISCSVLKPRDPKPVLVKTQADAPEKGVAVTVNGKPIMISQVQAALAQLPKNTPRDDNTVALTLNQLINDELLRQQAEKVEVSSLELAKARSDTLAAANITETQLDERLAKNNITREQFDASIKQQAQLEKLLNERLLLKEIAVTDESAREYYLANPNTFLQSEQAVMRQVFIKAEGRTVEQGQARAQQVIAKLNNTDFCELVTQYSDDDNSKSNCGVYVIPRGVIDPNLELASFNTPVNQTSVVTTSAGIHIVQTLQVVPAQVVPYNQVAANLQQNMRNSLFQQRLNLYLQVLRTDADIVSYLG